MSETQALKFACSLAYVDPTEICEIARCADTHKWDTLVVSDHLVYPEKIESPYPYTADGSTRWDAQAPWPDPWVAIASMAAVTKNIRFTTMIYILPLRNPIEVAKSTSTLGVAFMRSLCPSQLAPLRTSKRCPCHGHSTISTRSSSLPAGGSGPRR